MSALTLATAQALIEGALAHARAANMKPLSVIVLDAGAHPIAFAREDGASFARMDIARAKAAGSLGMEADTSVLAERARGNPVFFQSVSVALEGRIAFSPGGVLVRQDGQIVGAVGISGDTGENDEVAAKAGMAAAGL
ncbi:MAG: heme-binding protein [Sphingomonadales bacterium]|nr:heme-binding protein [Sphingomonadales bacterium]MDE2167858.1 heme-binding protein [Sphingomonadales bacterium]